jgi:N-acyl-D-aspartate/D-glutamate deacylase
VSGPEPLHIRGGQIAEDAFDAMVHVLREERLRVSMVRFAMSEADVKTVVAHPQTMIGSDGLPPGVGGRPHPRLFGTFPRVLGRHVREHGLLSVPEAIARMTSLPADGFGLVGRGRIASGLVADLVLFDPATVAEAGDYSDPVHPPLGIKTVIQSGHVVVQDGRWLGVRRGRRLFPA